MTFTARYKGSCHVCGDEILIKQYVAFDSYSDPYSNGRQPVVHLSCFAELADDPGLKLAHANRRYKGVVTTVLRGKEICDSCFLEKSITGECGCIG